MRLTQTAKNNISVNILGKNYGITLTELLVASVMVGIVMIGVASYSSSINRLQGSTNRSAIIATRAKVMMARIKRDAYLAVGSETNPGVVGYANNPNYSICFRHDNDVNPTPGDYTDDQWVCYYDGPPKPGGTPHLDICVNPTTIPVQNNAQCGPGGSRRRLLNLDNTAPIFYQIVTDPVENRFQYVRITLMTIFDQRQPFHEITNPRYTLTSQISPPGHSR